PDATYFWLARARTREEDRSVALWNVSHGNVRGHLQALDVDGHGLIVAGNGNVSGAAVRRERQPLRVAADDDRSKMLEVGYRVGVHRSVPLAGREERLLIRRDCQPVGR